MPKFWHFQFSTRMLICLVAVVSLLLGALWHLYVREARLVAALEREGFIVLCLPRFAEAMPGWMHAWLPQKITYIEGECNSRGDIALLNRCRNLEYLAMGRTTHEPLVFEQLDVFPQCDRLSLGNFLNDQELQHIVSSFPCLEDLSLDETQVTDEGLVSLTNLTNLKTLGLDGRLLTETGLQHISQIPSLHLLAIYSDDEIDEEIAARIIKQRPCDTIRFGLFTQVSDAAYQRLVDSGFEIRSALGCSDVVIPIEETTEQKKDASR